MALWRRIVLKNYRGDERCFACAGSSRVPQPLGPSAPGEGGLWAARGPFPAPAQVPRPLLLDTVQGMQ